MKTGVVKAELEGLSPLLMNRLSIESLKKRTVTKSGAEHDYDEEARASAYITGPEGKEFLYVPSEAVFQCLLGTARWFKAGKYPAKRVLAGSVRIEPDKIPLLNLETGRVLSAQEGKEDYKVDVRAVVIQRARVPRARATVENWKIALEIVYDKDLISDPKLMKEILEDAGMKTGILDWRPEKGGKFGTFRVSKYEYDGSKPEKKTGKKERA